MIFILIIIPHNPYSLAHVAISSEVSIPYFQEGFYSDSSPNSPKMHILFSYTFAYFSNGSFDNFSIIQDFVLRNLEYCIDIILLTTEKIKSCKEH